MSGKNIYFCRIRRLLGKKARDLAGHSRTWSDLSELCPSNPLKRASSPARTCAFAFGWFYASPLNFPALYKADENKHDGNHQKDVDKAAHCIGRHIPKQPHDDKN
jgi:hypothetical protein